jgi:hypothetical protein
LKSRNASIFYPLLLYFPIAIARTKPASSSVWFQTDVAVADDMTELALADRLKLLRSKRAELG